MDVSLNRNAGETEMQYIWRIGQLRDSGVLEKTWSELADLFNSQLREPDEAYTDSAYRKKYATMKQAFDEVFRHSTDEAVKDEIVSLKRELEKEKVNVRDERNEYRKMLREEARKESYVDQVVRAIRESALEHPLEYSENAKFPKNAAGENDLIIPLFDLHSGLKTENWWNNFDEKVLKERFNHYLDRIFEIQMRHEARDAYVVISEALSGNIHLLNRINNNQDLIEQFLTVTGYIAEFLTELSYRFNNVEVYVAPGNHSRITPKKEESLAHENMDNLIVPFLEAKLQNFQNIKFNENDIEGRIAIFAVRGQTVMSVHGDLDSAENVADNLRGMFPLKPNIILCGHRHTNKLITSNDVKVVQTGCMCGTDDYAISIRKHNRPEQAVMVINKEEGLDCIYDVKF